MLDYPEWNSSNCELPPSDGLYEITNIINAGCQAILEYDGYGFKHENHYVRPFFWRQFKPLEKKYGKII